MRRVVAMLLSIITIPVYAQHVAVLCEHDVMKTVVIQGEEYQVPDEDGKVYEGQLIKEQGNSIEIRTEKGNTVLYGCTTIDVE